MNNLAYFFIDANMHLKTTNSLRGDVRMGEYKVVRE